ncbi:peptidase A4 family-domain-containing protein [Boletus edulis BED1]|uniref:Peptidase A4 family-domain-containing protein n=1 Tax=Boletus edulis BED1 TaxID=1328754 RepID=A0AAD4C652_BOLED|nr:peptidase A4 family-domain-containing protein [Boletus edulis BED1]
MRFNSVLISCLLFAFAALAVKTFTSYTGSVWENQTEGTFNYVHGIFTVPEMSSPEDMDSFATVELIFDNDGGCPSGAKFRLGVNFHVVQNGPTYIQAQYQWSPDPIQKLNIPISTGDTVQLEFISHSTSGQVFVNNLSSHQHIDMVVNSSHALCGRAAGWVIQDEINGSGKEMALANFGVVSFTHANAGTRGEILMGPLGATQVRFFGKANYYDSEGHNMSTVIVYDDGSAVITFLSN